jgi:hypothetical protein
MSAADYPYEGDPYEDENSIYANDEILTQANVSELLRSHSLEELLIQDADRVKKADEAVSWFHGKISRGTSECLLRESK